ncbi:hypothetical protein Goe19_00990 [Bacillus phage vB_BsuM-Goe19]|nr:hypothetical protein Goe19_00990 [Bacillus phage vB_BsuM-Goe19]
MRATQKDIYIPKTITEKVTAVNEKINNIIDNRDRNTVDVSVSYLDADNKVLSKESYSIFNENFDFLMSQHSVFGEGKPKDAYRESDLWYVVDILRGVKQMPEPDPVEETPPTTEEPTTEEPITEEPITEEEPITGEPITEEPVSDTTPSTGDTTTGEGSTTD